MATDGDPPAWRSSDGDRQYTDLRASMVRQVLRLVSHGLVAGVLAASGLLAGLWLLLQIGGTGSLLIAGFVVGAGVLLGGGLLLGLVCYNAMTCSSAYDQRPQPDGLATLVRTRDRVLIRTESEGAAKPTRTIVFAHGIGGDMRTWHFQRANLPAGCRGLFYDARGHGRSGDGKLDDAVPGVRVLADDLGRVIDEAAPSGELILVGHSMGGMTIFALAATRPDIFDRVRGVMIIGSTPGPAKQAVRFGLPTLFAPAIWLLQTHAAAIARLAGFLPAFVLRLLGMGPYLLAMRWLASGGDSPISLTARRLTARMVYESNPRRYASHLAGIFEHDERPSLRRFASIPTTVIAGERDRFVNLASYDGWLHALPDARFVPVQKGSHMTMLSEPELVSAELAMLVAQGLPPDPDPTVAVTRLPASVRSDTDLMYVAVREAISQSARILAEPIQSAVKRVLETARQS